MFIITGSMIRHEISLPRSSNSRSTAAASLNGTAIVHFAISAGMPLDIGVDAGWSRPPIASAFGTTENITVSWCPWYEPSILVTRSRPVAARATRIASIVASVPEFAKRTLSRLKRRQSSSANATVTSVVAAKCVPVRAARSMASTTFGCAWPTTLQPKPPWKSTYSVSSTSHTCEPFPCLM